jgi:ATP-dependent Clp protease ATP-binding subunit ClpC
MQFTPRAKSAFRFADDERLRINHPCIGSQHVFFGLFMLGAGVQFNIVKGLGFTLESIRQGIIDFGIASESTQAIEGFLFGHSAVGVVERAAQEAAAMGHTYIGTEHILLGLLPERSGCVAKLIGAHNVDVDKARQLIWQELGFTRK